MAYEGTEVPVSRSQEAIRKLVMGHGGFYCGPVHQRFAPRGDSDGERD
jgi:hypothetical protein